MSIYPPAERNWWSKPVEKTEVVWVSIAVLWGLVMFAMMPYWHFAGNQNLSNEAYRISPDKFGEKTEAFAEKYKVREEGDTGVPVVHPPAGGDAYLRASLYEWWPILELEKGKSYRLHLSSMDVQHGFSLQPENINLEVQPGYEMVITITPNSAGVFGIICNEFCGVGHHTMASKLYVVER